ncbi:hypothetical protein AK812_SmicGene35379 [Symbiodinium microadriaticum]|uniref:Uncharacterized protein n=1 Tax=Symbiodinium microadriaticum TaxID=2951 RepID=A0A1Q9CLK8_SYMMI|nr:hypothetical protein AK812_SmicGene35379 [Symbiodinium microadriaticum]
MSDATVWGLCMQSVEIQASFDFHPSLMLQRETADATGFSDSTSSKAMQASVSVSVYSSSSPHLPIAEGGACFAGFTKFFWAAVLALFSLIGLCLFVPLMLEITRRRPPGQPLVLCGIIFDCCPHAKELGRAACHISGKQISISKMNENSDPHHHEQHNHPPNRRVITMIIVIPPMLSTG